MKKRRFTAAVLCITMLGSIAGTASVFAEDEENAAVITADAVELEDAEDEVTALSDIVSGDTAEEAEAAEEEQSGEEYLQEEELAGEAVLSETSGQCGHNLTWVLDDEGTLTISGTGDMWSFANRWDILWSKSQIKNIVIEDGVTSIGEEAFSDIKDLVSVEIPASVISLGVSAFRNCKSLANVTIPDSVTSIGSSAFAHCTGLKNVTIPDSVTSIGNSAFRDCTGLTDITIPDSVTSIGSSAFRGCTGLTDITIPDSVTSIDSSAFCDCTGLTTVAMPVSITTISSDLFSGCTRLTDIIIPDNITSIGDKAFCDCTSLKTIVIPDGVTSIGNNAFFNTPCYYDEKNWENNVLYINNHLIAVKNDIFGECIIRTGTLSIADNAFNECTGLTSVTIPNGIARIGANVFLDCIGLTSVTVPDSVKIIDSGAFAMCSSLTSVAIPDGVREIGERAFWYCKSLNDISLPDSLVKIGKQAFDGTGYVNDKSNWEDVAIYIDHHLIRVSDIPERFAIKDGTVCIAGKAFYWNETLKTVIIPKSVKSICGNAFGEGSFMSDVYYGGSESDRESISIDYGNSLLENAEWHYNYVPAEPVITLTSGHVKAENALYGTLIVSGYDKDGRLVKSEIIDGYESDLSGYYACRTLRAVLWSSTASMRPLTEAAVYQK